jgi:hypothetical protein
MTVSSWRTEHTEEKRSRQYAGGGSPASVSTGFGHAAVFEPQHVFVFVSQHCTPPASAGQLFSHSASVLHDGAHFFAGGAMLLGVDGGTFAVGAGSVGA